MKKIAVILALSFLSGVTLCEEAVHLKYTFCKGDVVTIESVNVGNKPLSDNCSKSEGRLVLNCETEEVSLRNDIKEASRLLSVVSLSMKHFKDGEDVPLGDNLEQLYIKEEQRLCKQPVRLRQTVYGYLTMHEKQESEDAEFAELLFKNFIKYVAVPLPEHPIKPGDRWKNPYFKPFGKKSYRSSIDVDEYEYSGTEIINGVVCAKIIGNNFRECPIAVGTLFYHPDSREAKLLKDKREWTKISETIYLDIEKGRIVEQQIKKESMLYRKDKEMKKNSRKVIKYSYEDK